MQYNPPSGSTDANASYVGKVVAAGQQGSKVPRAAVEYTQREIVAAIQAAGLTPSNTDLAQLLRAMRGQVASYLVDTGAANAIVVAASPAHTQYTAGQILRVKLAATITGPSTVKLDALAACALCRADGSPTQAGDGIAGQIADLLFDGVKFQIAGLLSGRIPKNRTNYYATNGTYTWTVPAGVTEVDLFVYGGGGGGGGAASGSAGGGGSAGGYCEGTFAVTPNDVLTLVVGAPGAAGTTTPTGGGNGGGSTVSSALQGALLSAGSGAGGTAGTSSSALGVGYQGGGASGGRFIYQGGAGGGGSLFNATRAVGGFGAPAYRGSIVPGTDLGGIQGYGPASGGAGGANAAAGGPGRPGSIQINY